MKRALLQPSLFASPLGFPGHLLGMSATPSTMLALGTPMPAFSLPDVVTGRSVSSGDYREPGALLVIFLCSHCPYVLHVAPELSRLARDYAGKSIGIIGITSNDVVEYPQDAPEPTARWASDAGLTFPILYDKSQAVAKAFTAACTPDFFLFDADRKLAYRGQLDDSRPSRGPDRPGRGELNGRDLRAAIDALLLGRAVDEKQMPSIGCNIKWRRGNEPAYFG
jgi:peroxiredoxin